MRSHQAIIKKVWQGDGLALIAGAVLPFAFAPFDIVPLAFIAPALLMWLWFGATQGRSVWRGYLFGIGYFGVGVSWVAVSMVRFGGIAMPLASLLTLLFVLLWALFPALVAYVTHRWFRTASPRLLVLFVIPSVWVLTEWIRGWLFTGFPWLSLGYTQVNGPLYGFSPLLGVYGDSWLTMFGAGVLLLVVSVAGMRQRLQYLVLFAVLGLVSFLADHIDWATPKGPPLKASLLQGNIPQDEKWLPENRQPSIDLYTRLTVEHWDSDIIIWPETALPAFFQQAKTFLSDLAQDAQKHHSDVLIGMPVLDASGNKVYYNSLVLLGDPFQIYSKRHLVPFGEYVPLKSLLGGFLEFFNIPMADFSVGHAEKNTLPVHGLKAGISICYEDAFGEEVIEALPQANLLINVSNDAWFGDSFAPHQHLQMAQMRALETARPMLRATNNGVSAIIDSHGNITAVSPQFQQAVTTGTFQPMSGSTPYVWYGNWLIVSLSSALLIVLGFRLRRIRS